MRVMEGKWRALGRFCWWVLPLLELVFVGYRVRAQCHFSGTHPADTVIYRFSKEETADGAAFRVRMTFWMRDGGSEQVEVPSEYISDLHVEAGTAVIREDASGAQMVVASGSGPVSLSYRLRNSWTGPLVQPHQFQPLILPRYFEVTGDKALVWLRRYQNARVQVDFDWQQLPATWALATSFGTDTPLSARTDGSAEANRALARRCQTRTGPWVDVNQALFAGGDFRLRSFKIGRRRSGMLAVRGTWTFSDEEAASEIGKTIELVRDFWHDDRFPYFLVTLQPFDQDHGSSDGSAFTDAFWMFVSRKDPMTGLLSQLAHESFHAWNPGKMGYLSATEYQKTKWFKEGFTEYYARKLSYEGGELSAGVWVGSTNRDLLAFPTSTDEYVRGAVIALWLDATIRRESRGKHSLDDVMFRMVRERGQPMTERRIYTTIARYVSAESLAQLKRAADQQGDLAAPGEVPSLGDCYQVTRGNFPTFRPGFDARTTRSGKTIAGTDPGGPAYQAGLRDGQTWVSSAFDRDDPNKLAVITILVDGAKKQVTYAPRGEAVAAWRYVPGAGRACLNAAR